MKKVFGDHKSIIRYMTKERDRWGGDLFTVVFICVFEVHLVITHSMTMGLRRH